MRFGRTSSRWPSQKQQRSPRAPTGLSQANGHIVYLAQAYVFQIGKGGGPDEFDERLRGPFGFPQKMKPLDGGDDFYFVQTLGADAHDAATTADSDGPGLGHLIWECHQNFNR